MTNMKEKNAYEKIYDVIRGIPEGKVASYGQVAELAGNRRWVRAVPVAQEIAVRNKLPLYHNRHRKGIIGIRDVHITIVFFYSLSTCFRLWK